MGVIRGARSFRDAVSDVEAEEECPLSDLIESADDSRLALDLSEAEITENRRRLRRQRRAALVAASANAGGSRRVTCGDVEGLSSRLVAHKGQRKQRRIQNDKQLRALCQSDDDLEEISIYDFIGHSVSPFALILQEKDNASLWEAVMNAEADDEEAHGRGKFARKPRNPHEEPRSAHPAEVTPEDCYRRLDSDMKRTLRRQRCPIHLIKTIEEQLETFFATTPKAIYRDQIDNSFARLMVHAVCEYMDLDSKSIDHSGQRLTLVKNPHEMFTRPPMALSDYLEARRSATATAKAKRHCQHSLQHSHHQNRLPTEFRDKLGQTQRDVAAFMSEL